MQSKVMHLQCFWNKKEIPNWGRAGFIVFKVWGCVCCTPDLNIFPQLGLPIRGSNCITKQPVGCHGVSEGRVPWGCAPPGFLGPPEPGSSPQSQKSKIAFGALNCKTIAFGVLSCQKMPSPKVPKSKSRKVQKFKSPKVNKSQSPKVQMSKS